MAGGEKKIRSDNLKAVARQIFAKAGSLPRECDLLADHLIEANLKGHDSHGIGMIPAYIAALKVDELKLNASPRLISEIGSTLVLDGGLGLGQSIAHDAMVMGIERAKAQGSSIVALHNSHHIGRIGHWAEQCAAAGLVSIHFVNVIAEPVVAPFGGTVARVVTNPISIGIPREGHAAVIVDFATSRLAHGKIRVAYNKGITVPEGTLIDAAGRPTNYPATLFTDPRGAILPFGEHKGWTLAFACEALAGALTGGEAIKGVVTRKAIVNNMLSILIAPNRIGTASSYFRELEEMITWVQSPAPGADPSVLLPGDPERKTRTERLRDGIPVDPATWAQILAAAGEIGVASSSLEAAAGL